MFTLISGGTICVSMCYNQDQIVAGFYNGSIVINSLANQRESSARQVLMHTCPPVALVLTSSGFICAAGSDGRILFYEIVSTAASGGSAASSAVSSFRDDKSLSAASRKSTAATTSSKQTIEWGNDISMATSSPSGTVIILASKDCLALFELEARNWKHKLVCCVT